MLKEWGEEVQPQDLTLETANALYKKHIWNPNRLEEVKNQKFANFLLYTMSHIGIGRVVMAVQEAARELGIRIRPTGKMDAQTLWAVNEEGERLLFYTYANIADLYCALHASNPEKYPKKTLDLWLSRLRTLVSEPREAACPSG